MKISKVNNIYIKEICNHNYIIFFFNFLNIFGNISNFNTKKLIEMINI